MNKCHSNTELSLHEGTRSQFFSLSGFVCGPVVFRFEGMDAELARILVQTSRRFRAAAAEEDVAIWVDGFEGDNGGVAVRRGIQHYISLDLLGPSEASVGIEIEELKGCTVILVAEVLPCSKARAMLSRRRVVDAGLCAAAMEHPKGAKICQGMAVAICKYHM